MSMIDGRIRLVAREDAPRAPGFVYAPQSASALRWDSRRGRFVRSLPRVLLTALAMLAAWALARRLG